MSPPSRAGNPVCMVVTSWENIFIERGSIRVFITPGWWTEIPLWVFGWKFSPLSLLQLQASLPLGHFVLRTRDEPSEVTGVHESVVVPVIITPVDDLTAKLGAGKTLDVLLQEAVKVGAVVCSVERTPGAATECSVGALGLVTP
ncbi:hypothetical protein ABW19_dt0206987 [Dactylella cylindrospora]|nr:hypothetical protein ABW19_dt0206987 [Dactylella cylindrospora]